MSSTETKTVTINLAGVSREVEIYKNGDWSPWRANASIFCKFPTGAILHRVTHPVVFDNGGEWEFSPQTIISYPKRRAMPVAWDSPAGEQDASQV